jgi:hypothetical protein
VVFARSSRCCMKGAPSWIEGCHIDTIVTDRVAGRSCRWRG